MFFSLSILGIACNRENSTARTFTDAEIQALKIKIEKDPLWSEYVGIMHNSINLVTTKNLYVNEALYKNPPQVDTKLAKAKSSEEARQMLLSSGLTEANANSVIKWSECVKNLQQKFPEMAQIDPQRLDLQVPPLEGNPSNATKNPKDFLYNLNKASQ